MNKVLIIYATHYGQTRDIALYADRRVHRNYRELLEHTPTDFFSVSMAASASSGSDPSGYLAAFFEQVDWKPSCAVAFGGALPYRKYGWFMRFVMKRISRASGHTTDTSRNHDFTDWDVVREFADEVADLLPAQPVARRML